MTPYDPSPATPMRRRMTIALMIVVALLCGPLAFTPAHAATSSVSGRVIDSAGVPIKGAWVNVWSRNAEDATYYYEDELGTWTDATGRFAIDLEPGTYKFAFEGDEQHVAEYYDDKTTFKSATPVVIEDDPISLVDAELELLPSVQGKVTAENGSPVSYGYVVAYRQHPERGWVSAGYTDTDQAGHYSLPIETGTYRIGFFDEDDEYVREYWKNAPTVGQAHDVIVGVDGAAGVDAELAARPVVPIGRAVNVFRPQVDGFVAVKQTLLSQDGSWKTDPTWIPDAVQTTRQWLRNGVAIPGATGATYQVVPSDVGSTLSVLVTGFGRGLEAQTVGSAPTGVVKWNSKVTASSKPGKKKARLTIRPTSFGGKPTGTVTIKLRNKVVKTVWLKNGRATVTLKLKRKQKYDLFYNGSSTIHPSRSPLFVKIK